MGVAVGVGVGLGTIVGVGSGVAVRAGVATLPGESRRGGWMLAEQAPAANVITNKTGLARGTRQAYAGRAEG